MSLSVSHITVEVFWPVLLYNISSVHWSLQVCLCTTLLKFHQNISIRLRSSVWLDHCNSFLCRSFFYRFVWDQDKWPHIWLRNTDQSLQIYTVDIPLLTNIWGNTEHDCSTFWLHVATRGNWRWLNPPKAMFVIPAVMQWCNPELPEVPGLFFKMS